MSLGLNIRIANGGEPKQTSSSEHVNDTKTLLTCRCSFLSFPRGWYGVLEIEIFSWVKTMEITIWCARNIRVPT